MSQPDPPRRRFLRGAGLGFALAACGGTQESETESFRISWAPPINEARAHGRPALLVVGGVTGRLHEAWGKIRSDASEDQVARLERALLQTRVTPVSLDRLQDLFPDIVTETWFAPTLRAVLVETHPGVPQAERVVPVHVPESAWPPNPIYTRPELGHDRQQEPRGDWGSFIQSLTAALGDDRKQELRAQHNERALGPAELERLEGLLREHPGEPMREIDLKAGNWWIQNEGRASEKQRRTLRSRFHEDLEKRIEPPSQWLEDLRSGHCGLCGMGYVQARSRRFLDWFRA